MSGIALELADRAVSIATEGRVQTSAPSAVFDGSGAAAVGTNAWRELRVMPRSISTRHLSAVLTQRAALGKSAMLLEAELQSRFAGQLIPEGRGIWIVAPAHAEAAGLAAVLGIMRRLGLPVEGFVDGATVTAAALGTARDTGFDSEQAAVKSTVVVELGLHHVAATLVEDDGTRARRRRAAQTHSGGLLELYQVWLDLISTTMVKRTRFDPLHDAVTEQQVFEAIEPLTLEAARAGSATASVMKGQQRFEAVLTRDQFSSAAQPLYRSMAALLHQLRPAGAPITLIIPQLAAELPGLRDPLEQLVGCELISVPDGFAAAATSLLDLPARRSEDGSVSLLRRLPNAAQPGVSGVDYAALASHAHTLEQPRLQVTAPIREALGQHRVKGPAPSHVLWDGRAYSLSSQPLLVGRGPSVSSPYLMLPEGLAGVSRRHCTFVHDGDDVVVLDHSTFGTFVNGARVQERVRIYANDQVRLGEPGVELTLIAVGEVAATTRPP